MTALVQSIRRFRPLSGGVLSRWQPPGFEKYGLNQGIGKRGVAVAGLVAMVSMVPEGWTLALGALSEAYLAVSVFVAGTLALVFAAERAFKADLGVWLQRHHRWQVPVATLLGAFPGCGGAIIAVTQYTRGYLSFGGVVATLTATMGDAMFLLLAREPHSAVLVLGISMVVAVIAGYVIDAIHGPRFMQPRVMKPNLLQPKTDSLNPVVSNALSVDESPVAGRPHVLARSEKIWLALIVPGVVIGLLAAFQVEVDEVLSQSLGISPAYWLGIAGAMLALAMWAVNSEEESGRDCEGTANCSLEQSSLVRSVIDTTNFVTAWVVFAFVGYELLMAITGIDLDKTFAVWAPLVPAMAILVGLIPGCGPQIMVTTLYLSGSVPFSAQLGNALANDGDALFPALAVAPKAALMATLYSAIPAILVAYGWYFLVEAGV